MNQPVHALLLLQAPCRTIHPIRRRLDRLAHACVQHRYQALLPRLTKQFYCHNASDQNRDSKALLSAVKDPEKATTPPCLNIFKLKDQASPRCSHHLSFASLSLNPSSFTCAFSSCLSLVQVPCDKLVIPLIQGSPMT